MFCVSAFLLLTSVMSMKCEAVQWTTNYEEASVAAKAQNKPIVLFFTGTDWCVWCKKLESEALATRDFEQDAGNAFIFVKLDFPKKEQQNPTVVQQNRDLQRRFDVRGYPTIVVLDPNGQKIGSTGYRPGGGKAYASHLLNIVNENSNFKAKTSL